MNFYKLEATHRVISNSGSKNKKTYKYYFNSYESMLLSFSTNLLNKSKVSVKEITEHEYVKGTR